MRAHSVMLGIAYLASVCECADRRRLWNTMEEDRATVESWVEENRRQPQLPWRMKPKLEKYFNQQVTLPRRIKKPSPGKGPPGKRRPPSDDDDDDDDDDDERERDEDGPDGGADFDETAKEEL